jgi:hypothetical protein
MNPEIAALLKRIADLENIVFNHRHKGFDQTKVLDRILGGAPQGNPAGVDGCVLFNDSGDIGTIPFLQYDKTDADKLSLTPAGAHAELIADADKDITIYVLPSTGSTNAGEINLIGGDSVTGDAGAVTISGGASNNGAGFGQGGYVRVFGGDQDGGQIEISAGNGATNADGGQVSIIAGDGNGSGDGGNVEIWLGAGSPRGDLKIIPIKSSGIAAILDFFGVGGSDKRFTFQNKSGTIAHLDDITAAHVIEEEGSPLTQRSKLNFIGAGVTATDNSGADSTDVTIPGGSPDGSDRQLQFNDSAAFGGAKISYTEGGGVQTLKADNQTVADTNGDDLHIVAADGKGAAWGGDLELSAGSPEGSSGFGADLTLTGAPDTGTPGDTTFIGAYGVDGDGGNIYIQGGGKGGSGTLDGKVILSDASAGQVTLETNVLSGNKTATFPNRTGIFALITSGSGAPGTTPEAVGQIYADTSGAKVYISTGTASSADWKIMN